MSLLGRLFGGGKKTVKITLTELGRSKAENYTGEGGIKLKIMSYLEENGQSSLTELNNSHELSGFGIDKLKMAVNQLYREGWVQVVKDSGV